MNKHMEWVISESASRIVRVFGRVFSAPIIVAGTCLTMASCEFGTMKPANFDMYIGTTLASHYNTNSIFTDDFATKVVRDFGAIKELDVYYDGCIFVFGVDKKTDIIKYWRVSPSPEVCEFYDKPRISIFGIPIP